MNVQNPRRRFLKGSAVAAAATAAGTTDARACHALHPARAGATKRTGRRRSGDQDTIEWWIRPSRPRWPWITIALR